MTVKLNRRRPLKHQESRDKVPLIIFGDGIVRQGQCEAQETSMWCGDSTQEGSEIKREARPVDRDDY